ncbi:CLUMA_CG006460, isoform A [Clunio marinus]|uniref:CLUMA_CG006460, isoform A n=1 Tax=Clunio marinus TaxID=568069 RepID=A0A1J1HXP7_9DIPT|nr:CLUMA_CG006460, isoform A [Clunio marinus]
MSHLMQTTSKGALQLKEISIIPITTGAVAQPQGKPSSSSQLMADENSADSLRKKRCTDRYDSSESSDRYVPTPFNLLASYRFY